MKADTHRETARATWVVVILLLLLILLKGSFAFLAIGDRGQPSWDYRPIQDVPGESPYAIYEPLPHPQHVRGPEGE